MPHYSKALEGKPSRRLAVGAYRVVFRADAESVPCSSSANATRKRCTAACGGSRDG
jgi:hypothetical protein